MIMRDMKNDLYLLNLMDLMPEKKNAGREKFQSVSIGGLGDIRLKAIQNEWRTHLD